MTFRSCIIPNSKYCYSHDHFNSKDLGVPSKKNQRRYYNRMELKNRIEIENDRIEIKELSYEIAKDT